MVIRIISNQKYIEHYIPKYAVEGDSGMDVRADIENEITLAPLERKLIPTGLYFQLQPRTEIQIRSRSGETLKKGLVVLNSPATIDSNYRGELGVIIANVSNENVTIKPNERIAQIVCARVEHMELEESDSLNNTVRGDKGYGSSGDI